MNNYRAFEAVKEFHQKNGAVIATSPTLLPDSTMLLRQRLMLEELGELATACHDQDLEKVADGLCDLMYVVLGSCVSLGIPIEADFSNAGFKAAVPSAAVTVRYLADLSQAITNCILAILDRPVGETLVSIKQVFDRAMSEINGLAFIYQIELETCFFEVHRANMSKNLGGATDGKKYGASDAKGEGFQPPNLRPILRLA